MSTAERRRKQQPAEMLEEERMRHIANEQRRAALRDDSYLSDMTVMTD